MNIERNIGKKSRKDLIKWEDVESDISYFFSDWKVVDLTSFVEELHMSVDEMHQLGSDFRALYSKMDDKDNWFKKVQEVAVKHGFAPDTKSYKESPEKYRGSIVDVANVLRVLVTGRTKSPDLYAIMQIMSDELLSARL